MLKGVDLFKDSYFIKKDSDADLYQINEMREEINKAFQAQNIDLQIDRDYTINRLILNNLPDKDKVANNISDYFSGFHLNDFFSIRVISYTSMMDRRGRS